MGIVTGEGGTMSDMQINMEKLQEQMKTMSTAQLAGLGDTLTKVEQTESGGEIEDFDKIMEALESQAKITAQEEAEAAKSKNGASAKIVKTGTAKGGVIVNTPTYLPSSGTVIGESPTFSAGKGMATGGASLPTIPDGGSEIVLPIDGGLGGQIVANAIGPQVSATVLHQMQMERIGLDAGGGQGSTGGSAVVDNSTNVVNNNNTSIRRTNATGQSLGGEDFIRRTAIG